MSRAGWQSSPAMSTWAPSAEGLQQLLGLFRASGSADNTQHRRIQQQLVDFNVIPDYNSYLAYIFNQLKSEDGAVRQMAGLVLKNNVKEHWGELSSEVQEYVRENLLGSLGDPQPYIRNVSGSCVTTVIYAGGLEAWPMLVPTLYQMLDSPDTNTLEGALSALSKICEVRLCDIAATPPRRRGLLTPTLLQGELCLQSSTKRRSPHPRRAHAPPPPRRTRPRSSRTTQTTNRCTSSSRNSSSSSVTPTQASAASASRA